MIENPFPDIYVSAYQALDWIFTHRLAAVGTLVTYDDWMDYNCAPRVNRTVVDLASAPAWRRWEKGGKQTAEGIWLDRAIAEASRLGRSVVWPRLILLPGYTCRRASPHQPA